MKDTALISFVLLSLATPVAAGAATVSAAEFVKSSVQIAFLGLGSNGSPDAPGEHRYTQRILAVKDKNSADVMDAATVDTFPSSEVERLTATGLGRFSQGDFAGAIIDYTNAIKINPKRGPLYLQRGLAHLELEEYVAALEDLNNAYELDKSNRLAILVCRGRAFTGLEKYDRAISDLDAAVQEDPKFVLAFISRADTFLAKGDDEKAIADLERALQLDPKQAKAYFLRARYYKNKNKNDLAMKDFSTAISLDSSFLDRDYNQTKSNKELRDQFTRSLSLGKGKEAISHLVERGLALERNGEYLEAIRELTDAISDSPDSLEAYKWRASVYMHMSSYDNAIADINSAITIAPKDPGLYALRAKANLDLGQYDRAIADYDQAVDMSPTPPASLYQARGLVYSRLGKSDEAIRDFTKSIDTDPHGSTAYADRGLEQIVHKKYKEAIADFTDSINREQDLAVAYKFRAEAKYYQGDAKGAIADLEMSERYYKDQKDLFGSRQVERMIDDYKKGAEKSSTASNNISVT